METKSPSLAGRAAAAVALTVGFYTLALGVAGALIAFPILGMATEDVPFNIWLAAFCIVTGLTILRAIAPRRERFEPPGPELTRDGQPELFGEIEAVAREVGEPLPEHVYLAPDVNAAVTEERRPFGAARRMLIVGLPLLQALTPRQLRAVIAHEFGHYVGGDTRLGPWTWRTRAAIGRTLEHLRDEESIGRRIVSKPFEWYARLFMRVTAAISRRQEFAADALAARVAGAGAQAAALRRVHAVAPAYEAYFGDELLPVLEAGYRPPIADGFDRFMASGKVREAVDEHLEAELREDETDAYDSHPSLRERLAALGESEQSERHDGGEGAARLLRDREALEAALVDAMATEEARGKIAPLPWDEVAGKVYLEDYRRMVGDLGGAFAGVTLGEAPRLVGDPEELGERLRRARPVVPPEDAPGAAFGTLAGATVLALAERGYAVATGPGEPIACVREGERLTPFDDLAAVARGDEPAERYAERYAAVSDVEVPSTAAPAAQAASSAT
jgi:Zn-dependent protease with chaperone function